jgi:S-adenosylmethionine hydrolase
LTDPIITLLTDFGLQDGYVASMKGVILGIAPQARLVDISHLVPPQDVRSAAFVLFTSYPYFPARTVHLAVVDPGVGTERRAVAVRTPSGFLVGPDNGIFSLVLGKESSWEARSIENPQFFLHPPSPTFHGRDIFAPTAAHLALGEPFETLGPPCRPEISSWSSPVRTQGTIAGEVIHIDRFGNAVTSVRRFDLEDLAPLDRWHAWVGVSTLPIFDTYARISAGSALALAGSSGFMEIAVNRGSAAAELELLPGSRVIFALVNP